MPLLSSTLRNQLERTVIAARDTVEEGAWAALERLAVNKAEVLSHMTSEQRELRVRLRAKGRQLGDRRQQNGQQDIYHLHRECGYEYWHQMLFARFLAENQLLMHPDGVAVSLEECEELAADQGTDGWTLAARYASRMLPQIFRPDDPLLSVTFAPEDKQALETLLADLPVEVFTADDSLGWVYQFWQTKRKKEVNESGDKIGADELPAVTQLFTEDYMVKFLLHNTLGAWWAGKVLADEMGKGLERSEDEWRERVALPGCTFDYLRFLPDGTPAAGTFPGWPTRAADLKIIDPCCGSGHFVIAAFDVMVRIRMAEEGLDAAEACDAVLRDSLFGLEIDPRCTQLAAFSLAMAAWRFCGGYRELPAMNIACSGLAPHTPKEKWLDLARDDDGLLLNSLETLYGLFQDAPTLGSLIDPARSIDKTSLLEASFDKLVSLLNEALSGGNGDHDRREMGIAARGIANAARLLADKYHLVITNVPYRTRGDHCELLQDYLSDYYPNGKADLATAFVERCVRFCVENGSTALVTPQNWLFLTTYEKLRIGLLQRETWNLIARLGPGAFDTISGEVVNVALLLHTRATSRSGHTLIGIDASRSRSASAKALLLRTAAIQAALQAGQLGNPDARLTLEEVSNLPLLSKFASGVHGFGSKDSPRFFRQYWETCRFGDDWQFMLTTVENHMAFGGLEQIVYWQNGTGVLAELGRQGRAIPAGRTAWGKWGVAVSQIGTLPTAIHIGDIFDKNVAVVLPDDPNHLPAIWCFCSSPQFNQEVRKIDQKLNVTNATLVKVPFDLKHWQKVAAERCPNGLPKPYSDDPTQWIFHGWPERSTDPLQVAIARLLGYRWAAEIDDEMELSDEARALVRRCDELLDLLDADGIVCIPAVAAERTAVDRLLVLLSACGVKPTEDLEDWLRDKFFVEHCQLFHQRPFIWHIWDGRRKDGFHALVNYHKLDRKLLEKLIYTHLGDWIARQKGAERRGESGAEGRRQDAETLQNRLKLILAGQPPYDIFVRWKPLEGQPIGWDPDLNDGVRINIRPFVEAGVLRKNPKIKWKKDRGKEPERPKEQYPWFWGWDEETDDFMGGPAFDGNRWNDCHYSNAVKHVARDA